MKIIHIENACREKWDNMQNTPDGKFCDLCSKTVLDLTQKSDEEILKILDEFEGKVCGRILKNQSGKNIFTTKEIDINPEKNKGYSRIVAGLAIAASLTGVQTYAAPFEKPHIQISDNKNSSEKDLDREKDLDKEKISDHDFIISGKLMNSDTGKPLVNIEVTFITLKKIFKAKTDQNGVYRITAPDFYIRKEKNLLHFDFGGDNDKDFMLTREEMIHRQFSFKDKEINNLMVITGGISSRKFEPTIFADGVEIEEEELYKLGTDNFKIFHFTGEIAKALCGKVSRDGLYLAFSK